MSDNSDLFEIEGDELVSFKAKDVEMDEVVVPDGVDIIGDYAFEGSRFKAVRFEGAVESICERAFADCVNLESVEIPGSVDEICDEAFKGCSSLREAKLSEGVGSIGYGAFSETALQRIDIPASVTFIGSDAFDDNPELFEICVDKRNRCFKSVDGNLYTKNQKTFVRAKKSASAVDIPNGVTKIDGFAFGGCERLTEVNIPDSVTEIGYGAFFNCKSLEKINFPSGLLSLGCNAFSGCEKLKEVSIPGRVFSVDADAFAGCKSLREAKICGGVKSIGERAFSDTGLERIKIPASVTYIYASAFWGASGLVSIDVDGENKDYVSKDGSLYTRDGKVLVCARKDIETFEVSEEMTRFDSGAFDSCTRLEKISIPSRIKRFPRYLFRGCSSLSEIDISNGLEEIYEGAFSGTRLKKIRFPKSFKIIEPGAFEGAEFLSEVEVDEKSKEFMGENGGLYTCDGEALIACAAYGATTFEVRRGTIEISEGAFMGCKNLKEVKLPDDLDCVAREAFRECASLERVELPAGLRAVGVGAFYKCKKLKYVKIPYSAEYVRFSAFDDCPALEELEFEDPYGWTYKDDDGVRYGIDPMIVKDHKLLRDFLYDANVDLMEKA